MNEIKLFNNEQFGQIRVATNENNEPLFCLADVCNVIGIANPRNVRSRLDDGDVHQMDTPTTSGIQQITFVTESGMYEVVIRSDSEKAKPFRKWVTSEVLPTIRKHGVYATPDTIEKMISDPDTAIKLLGKVKEEREKRLALEIQNKAMQPKVLFADAVATSDRSCLVSELAKILNQNGVSIGQNRLFQWLREKKYLCSKGNYYNQPTQMAMDLALFEIKKTAINKPDGTIITSVTTKVTGKGQIYFVNKFLSVGAGMQSVAFGS